MPKRPKRKKLKAKKSKPLVSKKFREMIVSLIERLGGASAVHKDRKNQLVVRHENYPPFIVNLAHRKLVEIVPTPALADEQQGTLADEQQGTDDNAQQQGAA